MSLLTNWGYSLSDAYDLCDMLDKSEYAEFAANRYASDPRIAANITAASMAIRNYCGWHIYPSAECELHVAMNDRRVTLNGRDLLIQLPSKFVTAVSSVAINDVEYDSIGFETNGILRVYDINPIGLHRYSLIDITFTSGLPDALMHGIKELIAHRVTHALASSNGVTTEQAGGVSVTYNANWINSARATALPDDNKEVLAPYRLQGVF